MTNRQLQKPDWGDFEPASFDQNSLVERFRRAETKISSHTNEFVISRWRKINEVRRPVIIWSLLIVVIFGAMAGDLIFGQIRYQTEAPASNSTIIEGVVGTISSLNPLFAQTEADQLAERLIFSRLYERDQTGALKGDLARSVTVSGDELSYTVMLRDDVLWHDGEKLTAEDVKYTVDLFKNQALSSFTGQVMRGVGVKVLGDYSLEFKLRSTYAPFLSLLDFPVLPQHILSKYDQAALRDSDFASHPVGSGKFKFQTLQTIERQENSEQILTLIFNEKYHQRSQVERLELRLYPTSGALANGLKNNEVGAVASNRQLDVSKVSNIKTATFSLNSGVFAFFNMKREVLNSVDLRLALREVINVEELRQMRFAETGVYSGLDLPILSEYLDQSATKFAPVAFDVEQKMTELGYRKKDGKWLASNNEPLKLTVASVKNAQYQSVAEHVVRKLQEFGIDATLKLVDVKGKNLADAQEVFSKKNYDILVYEIGLGSDPDVYGFWHSSQTDASGLNFSNYSNSVVDDLLATARLRSDYNLRQAKYDRFLQQWLADVPAVGLLRSNLFYYSLAETNTIDESSKIANAFERYYGVLSWSGSKQAVYKTP